MNIETDPTLLLYKEDINLPQTDQTVLTISIPECPICLNSTDNALSISNCNHLFCIVCLTALYNQHNYTLLCPLCRSTTNDNKMNNFIERTQLPTTHYVQFGDNSPTNISLNTIPPNTISIPYGQRVFTYCLIASTIAPFLYIFWFNN